MKPTWVRYVRLFCAAAVLTVAGIEVWTTTSDIATLGWGAIAGAVAMVIAKKVALFA